MDALGFLQSQTRYIKDRIYNLRYPEIDFAALAPVTMYPTGPSQFMSGIEHYTADMIGQMIQISPNTTTLPLAELDHQQHQVQVSAWGGAIGYNWFEMNQAMFAGDTTLLQRKEASLRRAHDQVHWDLMLNGRSDLGWNGLINSSNITAVDATKMWTASDITAAEILKDFNDGIEGVYVNTNTVDMADTVYLPVGIMSALSSNFINGTDRSVMSKLMEENVYTLRSKKPLMVRELRGLENAAAGNAARAIFLRKDIDVLEYHMVMPLMMGELYRVGPYNWIIPGTTRTGGLEIKLPSSMRYLDLIAA